MGFIDMMIDWINWMRIRKINTLNRGVTEYQPSYVGGFVDVDSYTHNTVISGGSPEIRGEATVALGISALNAGVPMIVLHRGNYVLEQMLSDTFASRGLYVGVNPKNPCFEPLAGLPGSQIGQILIDAAPSKYALSYDGASYVEAMRQFIAARKRTQPTLTMLVKCPHGNFDALVANAGANGSITPTQVMSIQSFLIQGQTQSARVSAYLNGLQRECATIMPHSANSTVRTVGICDALKRKGVFSIDVLSDGNIHLLRLLAEEIKLAINGGNRFYLVIDGLMLTEENGLKSMITSKSGNCHVGISADDFYSACGGDEKLFSTLLGDCHKWFVFRHGSGLSADMWSKALGEFEKFEKMGGFGVAGGAPVIVKKPPAPAGVFHKPTPVVYAKQIQDMQQREGFVYTASPRELAHIKRFL